MKELQFYKEITLKDGRKCILRNGTEKDGQEALDNFILTHEQTDFLMTYPDEITFTAEEESNYLKKLSESENEAEILALVDGKVVGTAGISCAGAHWKTRHRAEFGVSIDRAYWNLGIGRALTKACIECAAKAGYRQIELEVVTENTNAYELYKSEGFVEYGRKPRAFRSRISGWQELILMRMELD